MTTSSDPVIEEAVFEHESGAVRTILIIVGTIAVIVGVVGIFLPLLPTTPFLLLAAACYARSSRRFYTWLLTNPWLGAYISDYRAGRGVPMKVKASILALLWATILVSAGFFVESLIIRAMLLIIALAVTMHVLSIKTRVEEVSEK
ncbi:MAG: YbaN family protein [Candidatus Undinarchaeales archaeon]|jgi:hypothetical protein|nr:YbaN family protein [Candidatus Undinarchaeales archaeon]MDP7493449.1 YbaN family protein [Candidatus Undinarchaeales archaeon]